MLLNEVQRQNAQLTAQKEQFSAQISAQKEEIRSLQQRLEHLEFLLEQTPTRTAQQQRLPARRAGKRTHCSIALSDGASAR
jgi:chromosome segregation ATPase